MNFMFDFHGVIDHKPTFFRTLMGTICQSCQSNLVVICTGERKSSILEKLDCLGFKERVHYHKILSITDHLEKILPESEIEYDTNNNIWVDEITWWSQKGKFCIEYSIDAIYDDSEFYLMYVPNHVAKFHYQTTRS